MNKISILLVDDEIEFVETLAKRLAKRGLDVKYVLSGAEALKLMSKEMFDVAVVDVRMPEMDGITLLGEMKRTRPLMETILLTGYAAVHTGIEGMKQGAFDYLIKPTEIDKLLEKIKAAFEKKRTHDEKIRDAQIKEMLRNPQGRNE
jgi:DNA-binding NtrC family response regulator